MTGPDIPTYRGIAARVRVGMVTCGQGLAPGSRRLKG